MNLVRTTQRDRQPGSARAAAPRRLLERSAWLRVALPAIRLGLAGPLWLPVLLPQAVSSLAAAERSDEKPNAAAKVTAVTFDTIKLEMKKGDPFKRELLTDAVKKLDGKPIRIRGYILPSFQQSGIKQFVLVRDNMECCFGPGALLFDCIMVEMVGDASTDYTVRPVAVEGQFSIKEVLGPDQKHLAIYHLDAKSVK